jgi:hypothetical protein
LLSFNRNQWEAYVGIGQKEAAQLFKDVLRETDMSFEEKVLPPVYMYDSKHNSIELEADGLVITLIYVSGDPLTRFFSGIVGSRKHFEGVTFLTIKYKDSKLLAQVLTQFNQRCQTKPWQITKHPRFQFAFLLQAINRYKWSRVCN